MKKFSLLLLTVFVVWGCTNNAPSGPNADDFDRQAILENWANNLIIPGFTHFAETTAELQVQAEAFSETPSPQNLTALREAWKESYLAFQHVSMFEMGKAMELNYRNNLNIYPTDTDEIEGSIESGEYNLALPSLLDSQGFPALDYLLYGLGENDAEILNYYTTNTNAEGYRTYLVDLSQRIDSLTKEVLNHWTSGYRDEFVSNTGNDANASLDMMVNDYIYYYEKHLRAGKIGIPAGVFSGSPLSGHVEAYYSDDFSKALFNEALTASINFFNGTHFNSDQNGQSLDDYLEYLEIDKEGSGLATLINTQFDSARSEAENLNPDFAAQVESDNSLMLSTYDELQRNVVFMKVDMLQALNINVDYVDADGD
ncbi:imelysin family protein [Gracilimonas mengyeensis]|uniref:Imelysin n=1 Tax=Gracilimonas mengyeensis TaxID=1302730 RepID=A0A521F3S0_9BACT|nr:imelysin family protein [Gracilimonas mengyeensis]SMO90814.1 Imelysin [Gracilimonas mengyeensis]